MIEQLTEIRNNILSALEQNDGMLAKMYVNKLDTLLHSAKNNTVKNIHILPTDKPTGIFESKNGLHFSIIEKIRYGEFKGFHIYITSDEEIKDGDWCINIGRLNEIIIFPDKIIGKADYTADVLIGSNWRKIILTTDPDLIKDGVQPIDDKFLEWFVKNPSCESVDVNIEKYVNLTSNPIPIYKIIIPQEEPKQETLEEYAKIWVNNRFTKQICGNESYPDIHASKEGIVESHILFAKWQQERMYSEEEVLEILFKSHNAENTSIVANTIMKWFEQFKKK